ncbi:MAG TPA: cadherin-like domain-containing protein, partial [Saprospiraceae bacterium]|nr:cadherin-like domain-containing protein [Saprospiraceae bacterium]
PSGKKALLFDRVGAPADPLGCDGQNLQLVFDDESPFTAQDLESTCAPTFPALAGSFQPVQSLSTLEGGKNVKGNWTLELTDHADESGGWFISWSLTFCFPDTVVKGQLLTLAPLTVPTGGSAAITENLLRMSTSGPAEQGRYVLLSPPQHGTLLWGNTPLGAGGIFTQADLQLGVLKYAHSGDTSTADSFRFDALDASTQAWVHDSTFRITVKTNDLAAAAALTQEVPCHNGRGGELTASATGLDGNYLYSLNGSPAQSSPVFSDLTPGTYTLVVTGQYGFTATATATVPNPALLEAAANVTDNDLVASALGGAGGYTYSLDGTAFQADGLFADLPNGTYMLTVRDANGCTASDTAVVLVNT